MEFFKSALLAEAHADNAAYEARRQGYKGNFRRAADLWTESQALRNFARLLRENGKITQDLGTEETPNAKNSTAGNTDASGG